MECKKPFSWNSPSHKPGQERKTAIFCVRLGFNLRLDEVAGNGGEVKDEESLIKQ
jgi:hypothetical protein